MVLQFLERAASVQMANEIVGIKADRLLSLHREPQESGQDG